MYKAKYSCDLHTHTNRSDGNDTCRELVDNAAESGVKILALTDHDIIAPATIETDGGVTGLTDYAKSRGVALLPGIEFSCDTAVDDVHIIALGCDYSHPFFEREYQNSILSKIDGYKKLCRLLTRDGIAIDWSKDVLLDGHRAEKSVQRKHIFEAMAEKGYAREWSDAKILINKTEKYSVRREKPDPLEVIINIHKAGGVSILAHPFLIRDTALWEGKPTPRAQYIDHLIRAGLDGIEVSYPYDKVSYDGDLTPEQIEDEARRLYADRLPILSGGSDYHNEGKKGSGNPRMLGERGVDTAYFMSTPLLRKLLPG